MPTPVGTVSVIHVAPALVVPIMTGLLKTPKPTAVQSDVVAHEIPLSPTTLEGIACGLHVRPSLTEKKTELTPTTKQSTTVGHDTEFSRLVPAGGTSSFHDVPPFEVLMIVDPDPRLPVLPTATQSSAAEQETPVRSTALLGAVWSVQVEPLSEEPTTKGVALRLEPTAMHVDPAGQTTALSCWPLGSEPGDHNPPPSEVLMAAPPPAVAMPTAVHWDAETHETPESIVTEGC